jgi:hypothetical protein
MNHQTGFPHDSNSGQFSIIFDFVFVPFFPNFAFASLASIHSDIVNFQFFVHSLFFIFFSSSFSSSFTSFSVFSISLFFLIQSISEKDSLISEKSFVRDSFISHSPSISLFSASLFSTVIFLNY